MRSTPQEIQNAQKLIKQVEVEITQLIAEGNQVHMIWDFDGVISSPLSDDIYSLAGSIEDYFNYETRLFLSPPRPGIWLPLAKKIGRLHTSQDIVTARSSFIAFRVMTFCLWHCGSNPTQWVRWILFLGHQSKADSFRIILESFKREPRVFIVFVDDSSRHVKIFDETSQKMGMAERTTGIISPKIRDYDEGQLRMHYDSIVDAEGDRPTIIPGFPGGYTNGFIAFPNGLDGFRELIAKNFLQAEQGGAIEKFGPLLELTFKDLFPGEPVTPVELHYAFNFLQGEAAYDTMVLNEVMEEAIRSGKLSKDEVAEK